MLEGVIRLVDRSAMHPNNLGFAHTEAVSNRRRLSLFENRFETAFVQLMFKERALRSNPRRHLERNLDTFPVFRPETLRIFGIPGGRHAGFNFGRVWIIRVVFVDDVLHQWQISLDTV